MNGVLLSVLFSTTHICLTITACPDSWEYYDEACYKVIEQRAYQATAREKCLQESSSSDLVSIHSSHENLFVIGLISRKWYRDAWIGLEKRWHSSTWEWTDGTGVGYTNWNPGEPHNFLWENCVQMFHDGRWSDHRCNADAPPVCKQKYNPPPVNALSVQPSYTPAVPVEWTTPIEADTSQVITFSERSGTVTPRKERNSTTIASTRLDKEYKVTVFTFSNSLYSNGTTNTTRLAQSANVSAIVGLSLLPVFVLTTIITLVLVRRMCKKHQMEEDPKYCSINMNTTPPAIYTCLNTDTPGNVDSDDVRYDVIPAESVTRQFSNDGYDYIDMGQGDKRYMTISEST